MGLSVSPLGCRGALVGRTNVVVLYGGLLTGKERRHV